MSFINPASRKILKAENTSDIKHIDFKDKYIFTSTGIADFNRLYLIGCPLLPIEGKRISIPKKQGALIDANRKQLTNKLYIIISTLDRTDRSKYNFFSFLVSYFRIMDFKNIKDPFSYESVKYYIGLMAEEYRNGIKGKTLSLRQSSLKTLIKELDIDLYHKCKDLFITFPNDIEHTKPYTDSEIKEIANALYTIYKDYSSHIINNTEPDVFPLNYEINSEKIIEHMRATNYKNNSSIWKADLSRVAYFLTCFYTGLNSTSLLNIKISDITEEQFKNINRKTYTLKTKKGRQNNRTNNSNSGFSKKAKKFIESWILISKKLNSNDNEGFLFPNIKDNINHKMTVSAAGNINKVFLNLGLPALTSKRFRKTKASLIMRATESIYMVAQGLDNTVETASRYYSDRDTVATEFSLASALYVREKTALGTDLNKAVLDSSYIFKDPVRESILNASDKRLTNGLRCSENHGEKSKKLKDLLIKENLASQDDTVACYKFLECFGCEFHAVVAEAEDIWLLLSFNDIILEAVTRPSINSTPSEKLKKVSNTVQAILIKLKKEHSEIYNRAYQNYIESPHPLWEDISDLNLIMDIY